MTAPYHPTPPANYPDPEVGGAYAIDTAGCYGSYYGGGYGDYGGVGGTGLAGGYPRGPATVKTPAILGYGSSEYSPDGGVALSRAIDDVIARLGPGVYDQMMADDAVSSCIGLLVYSILGGEVHVEPAIVAEPGERLDGTTDPARRRDIEDAKKYAEECKRSLNRVPEFLDEMEAIVADALVRGAGLGDMAWELVDGEDGKPLTLLKSIQARPATAWAMVVDRFGRFVEVMGSTWEGPRRFPRDRFFVYVNGRRKGDPRGTSELRAAYDPWNFKAQARPHRGKWVATFANPSVLITYDENVPPQYPLNADGTEDTSGGLLTPQSQAERVAANWHGGSWAAVPQGWTATLTESRADGGAFTDYEEACNKAIAQAILLNSRTNNEAAHGSKADSQSSVSTTMVKVARKQRALIREIERSIFRTQTLMNHGEDAANRLCPRAAFADPDTADLAAQITAWVGAGYKAVPRQYAALDAKFGVPIRSADEIDELQAADKAAQEATIAATQAKAMPKGPQDPAAADETTQGPAVAKPGGKAGEIARAAEKPGKPGKAGKAPGVPADASAKGD